MYQELEHWKQYKLEKESKKLQKKIAVTYELDKLLKPNWVGEEVSGVSKYLNYNLSINPYSQWR